LEEPPHALQSSNQHAHEVTAPAIQSKTAVTTPSLHRSRIEGIEPPIPDLKKKADYTKPGTPSAPLQYQPAQKR